MYMFVQEQFCKNKRLIFAQNLKNKLGTTLVSTTKNNIKNNRKRINFNQKRN